MGRNGSYRTSDLYIAAWLLSNGLQIQGIDRHNPRRCDFIFMDREDRPQLVQAFVCGRAEGNLPFTDRTARNYMRLYRERDKLKTESVSDLSGGYNLLSAPLIELRKDEQEEKHRKERERIEYAREHPEECPVGEVTYGKAGAGWDCKFTIVGQLAGLPITHCECLDPEYWRLKEGEAPYELLRELQDLIYGIRNIEGRITKCLRKYADVINQAYWADWDRGFCSMSPELTEALADLANVIREFNRKQAPSIEKLAPPSKGSGQPRHGWAATGAQYA